MSAAVEASHRSHFSPPLDTMARPGSGWGHDPYVPRHGGYVQDQQYSQAPQPSSERLPGPSSLLSSQSHAAASPPPHAPTPAHQYPTSPPGRDAHYSSNHRPAYYTADYATPSPITQTPPLLPGPAPEQPSHYYPLAPRRHPDARLSPTQSSATSDRSDDVVPPDGSRGHGGGHFFHPSRGLTAFQQAPPAVPNPGHHMHQPSRPHPQQEDNRHAAAAGSLMGKLVPQSYSANGRQARSNAPLTPTMNHQQPPPPPPPPPPSAPHLIKTQLPPHQQQPLPPADRQPIPPAYHSTSQQQYQSPQYRQKYSTSPPPMSNGYPAQMEQYPPMPPQQQQQQQQQQQHQNSLSPRQEPVKMSIHSILSGGGDAGGSGVASSASSVADGRVAGSSTRAGTASIASSPSTSSQKAPAMPPRVQMAPEYRIQTRPVGPMGIPSSPSTSSQKAPVTAPSVSSTPDCTVQALQTGPPSVAPPPSVASQKAPATASPPPTPSEYRIQVRQQPVAARSCGFGERDRRVIDPPPIVQLFYNNPNATPDEVSARIRHPFSVVHCSIWNETGEQDNSAMPEDYRQQRRLMGTLVASPFVGYDDKGEEGCFFCFPDLSCRTPGNFRLKFSLVVISPRSMQLGSRAPILGTAMSEVFTVYNAKDFPGMQASTPLTKRLKEQGCLISIKKGNDKAGGGGGMRDRDNSDDEDDDDAGGGGGGAGGGGAGPSGSGAGPGPGAGRRKRPRNK